MSEDSHAQHSRHFFIISFLALFVLGIFIIRSYILTAVYSAILAYIFYPVYKKIAKTLRNTNIAAVLTILLIVILIIIPFIFTANVLIKQSLQFFQHAKTIELEKLNIDFQSFIDSDINLKAYLKDALNKFSLYVAKTTSDFLVSLPKKIIQFFVMLFILFYLFKEGPRLIEKFHIHIPLREVHRRAIAQRFNNVIFASLYGIVVTAFIQGIFATIGFWIFDIPSPILWGLVTVILSMIPFIGAWVIWLPASLYKFFSGDRFDGIGLFIYGLLLVSTLDNFIRPKIIGSKGKIHPVIVLLGVLGGLEVFGLLGIIIGPILLSVLEVFFEIYVLEKVTFK